MGEWNWKQIFSVEAGTVESITGTKMVESLRPELRNNTVGYFATRTETKILK